MSVFVVSPHGVEAQRWANEMALSLSAYGTVPRLTDPTKWKIWANNVISLPALAAVQAPRPEQFSTWRDWAAQFNLSLRVLE